MSDITLAGITLPGDLFWVDEFTAWRVGQSQRPTLTGALVVHESARQAGRPITLQSTRSGDAHVAPVLLPVLQQLHALEATVATVPLALVLPDHNTGTRSFSVLWNRAGGTALEAAPLAFAAPYIDGDWFAITLRLLQV